MIHDLDGINNVLWRLCKRYKIHTDSDVRFVVDGIFNPGCTKGPDGMHQWDLHLDRIMTKDYMIVCSNNLAVQ